MNSYAGFLLIIVECIVPALLAVCYFKHSLKEKALVFYELFCGDTVLQNRLSSENCSKVMGWWCLTVEGGNRHAKIKVESLRQVMSSASLST